MFGRMPITPLVGLDSGKHLGVAVAEFLAATEYPQTESVGGVALWKTRRLRLNHALARPVTS
jgi:hypothetical protein